MTQREQLIEEVAQLVYAALPASVIVPWEHLRLAGRDEMRERALDILAVFEGAYTPTDDEREALVLAKIMHRADCGCDEDPGTHDEPYWTQAQALVTAGLGFHRTVQGEPSDAQVEAALQSMGHSGSGVTPHVMRAALIAAAETGGERDGR